MVEKKFSFWQDHSDTFLEMAFRQDHAKVIAHPDGYAQKTGVCGDTVEFFLMTHGGVIAKIGYRIDGCLNTNACVNTIVQMVEGNPINQAWEVTPEKVAAFLKTLPGDHFHCAELAVGTLYLALANLHETQRTPWKKLYR